MTLLEKVTGWIRVQFHKHGGSTPEEVVNKMTPMELLAAISEALEEGGINLK